MARTQPGPGTAAGSRSGRSRSGGEGVRVWGSVGESGSVGECGREWERVGV